MTRRVHNIQTSYSSGEWDPLAAEREDIEAYFASASEMTNAVPIAISGFTRRNGLEFIQEIRNTISQISTAGATVSAPEGGTAANGFDGDENTFVTGGAIGVINPYVLLLVDFTVATSVDLVDVINISLSAGSLDGEFRVQSSTDNVIWADFGQPFNIDASNRSRRRSQGPALPVVAQFWRLVRLGSTNTPGTVSVAELKFFNDSAVLSSAATISFTFSDTEQYILVLTNQNIDIWSNEIYVASAAIPQLDADIVTTNWTQSLDTLILFHKNHQPHRLFRQSIDGSDDEWDFRAQPFTNIPQFDYGDSPGGVDEVQQLKFLTWVAGETFNIFLDTERTSSIAFGATIAATAASIQTALRALPNTSATGISCVGAGDIVTVTFSGEDGFTNFPELNVAILTTIAGVVIESTVTEGEPPGEDIISDARGWPRCGTFYSQRLFMGGFKSLSSHILYSVLGDFFNLDDRTVLFDRGFVFTADTDQAAVIYQLFAGQHLQVFTSSMEFFIPAKPVSPLTTAIDQTTRRGIPEGVRVVENEGASFFIQKGGNAVREYLFTDTTQSYEATQISLLATHLILNPNSVALNPARAKNDSDVYIMTNDTSDATVLVTLRDANITGFARFRTKGKFISVASEDLGDLYCITERVINGVSVRYLEKFDDEIFMDAGRKETVSIGTTQLTDLDWLEGEEIFFIIDGSPSGSATVTGGIAILPVTANIDVIYGLNFVVRVESQGVKTRLPNGTSAGTKKRILEVDLSLFETTNVEVGANGNEPSPLFFRNLNEDLLDSPLSDFEFTGNKEISGITGWVKNASVVIQQSTPGKLTVRALSWQVATKNS